MRSRPMYMDWQYCKTPDGKLWSVADAVAWRPKDLECDQCGCQATVHHFLYRKGQDHFEHLTFQPNCPYTTEYDKKRRK